MARDGFSLSSFLLFALRALSCIPLVYFPIYLREAGYSGFEIGFLMGIDSVTALLATFLMGVTNDLWTSRSLLLVSFFFLAVAFFIIPYCTAFLVLAAAFLLLGVFTSLAQVSVKALVYKTTKDAGKGRRFSVFAFAEHAGIAAGSIAGGVLLASLRLDPLFRITALLFLAVTPWIFLLPRTRTRVFSAAAYRRDLWRKEVLLFSVVVFLFTFHWGAEKTVYALFLNECLGLGPTAVGVFIGCAVAALAVSALFFGRLLDMNLASLKRLIVAGIGLSAAGHLLLALSTDWKQAFLFRIVHEVGDACFILFAYVMTSNLFTRSRIGGGSGFISQVAVVAGFLGALASGLLLEGYGPRVPMIAAAILALPALYFVHRIPLVPSPAEDSEEADVCAAAVRADAETEGEKQGLPANPA